MTTLQLPDAGRPVPPPDQASPEFYRELINISGAWDQGHVYEVLPM